MSMNCEYTINDAYHEGFECGVVYILRFLKESGIARVADLDMIDLACHLELRKPWKTAEEWVESIRNS